MEQSLEERTELVAADLIERLDNRKLKWSENTAIVGVYEDEKKKPYFSGTQVCHAGLSNLVGCKRVVNALMSGEGYATGRVLDGEVELWFVDYILNRSPYAETFITKDAVKALEQKYTISSGDTPVNLMAAGMVALRRLWEYTFVAKAAYDLAKAGVNEDLAFLLGHLINAQENPGGQCATTWNGCHAGHCSINPGIMSWREVNNFLAHKLVNPKRTLAEGEYYNGYDQLFGRTQGNITYYQFVRGNFPYADCKEKAGANLNPFVKAIAPAAINNVPYNKAIEVMAEWAKTTLMKEIENA
ncbi:hypothetical protein D3C81_895590 [compost metagenome]